MVMKGGEWFFKKPPFPRVGVNDLTRLPRSDFPWSASLGSKRYILRYSLVCELLIHAVAGTWSA